MKCLSIWLTLALMLVHSPMALAEDWSADREIHCRESLSGCQMLQMVMMGMFDAPEPREAVTERVLAAAWLRLMEVTEGDLVHFCDEFGEDRDAVRECWYNAMASCLHAFIQQDVRQSPQRRVLALFLDGAQTPEARQAREEIRRDMTESVLSSIADDIEAPVAFVQWILFSGGDA